MLTSTECVWPSAGVVPVKGREEEGACEASQLQHVSVEQWLFRTHLRKRVSLFPTPYVVRDFEHGSS